MTMIITVVALGAAAPANADVDTDFANALQAEGIYGPRDYNAWLAKLACQRLANRIDADAFASVKYLSANLNRSTSNSQTWKFVDAAISTYCPELAPDLAAAAAARSH